MLERWNPPVEINPEEEKILKRCQKQKLWRFFRLYRHQIFDETTWQKLRSMYAKSGRGDAKPPEMMALALLLQVTFHIPDHEVPALTACDRRWRMVLDALNAPMDEELFCQGSVFNFRERARTHGFMSFLLDRTVELARTTKGFSHKHLRAMIDSSPLVGAGRIEDTFNLLGRAIGQLVDASAKKTGQTSAQIASQLELTVVSHKSVKAALDLDWRLPDAKNQALGILVQQFQRLRKWLQEQLTAQELQAPPVGESLAQVERLLEQDIEPDPHDPTGAGHRLKQGGSDRQISLSDPDMRHGRKSKTQAFAGYKRHIMMDGDVRGLVVGVEVLAGNVTEHEGAAPLVESAENRGYVLDEAHVDRGYWASESLQERRSEGLRLVSKPPSPRRRPERLSKADFDLNLVEGTATCPNGKTVEIRQGSSGQTASFLGSLCGDCPLKSQCLNKRGRRVLKLHANEALHQQMSAELATPEGRQARRERVQVEHGLARLGDIQGTKARYRGLEKNQAHTEACAVIANLHVLNHLWSDAA